MRLLELLFGAAVLCSTAPAQQPPKSGLTRVPVAPPRLTIVHEGEPAPVWREPPVESRNEIFLKNFDGPPPVNVEQAITVLRSSLPPDYIAELMREFGYVPGRQRTPVSSGRTDLRELDLARFLSDRWVHAQPETTLAREFSCLSWGEYSISTFLTLLTYAEARSGQTEDETWQLRPSLQRYRISLGSVQNARTASSRCRQLVERGWTGL